MLDSTQAYLSVTYDAESHLLTSRWRRSVMPFELQQGYQAILAEAVASQCRYWLIDTSTRSSGINPDDVFWLLEQFVPQLQQRLGSTVYVAYLMAPHQLAGMLANARIAAAETADYTDLPYLGQRFTEELEATAWLRQCQLHTPTTTLQPNAQAS